MIEIIETGTKTTTKCKEHYIKNNEIRRKTMKDNVNHPDHYQNIAGAEAIDILNDVVKDLPGTQAAMLWNSMKYLFRFQNKNGVEDLKKARNYLDYLIADIEATTEAAKNIMANSSEVLWDTWFSNEYGNMTIYSKSKVPNGMPSKLVFDTKDAAEEFQSVFYNLLSEGYDEFSITDAALEMKFKIAKGNDWNKWDEPINWKELHDEFTIKPYVDKYELIFGYKSPAPKPVNTTHGPCVIYDSKISGKAEVHYDMHMFAGTCTTIVFTSELARDLFINNFLNKLGKKRFSIRDVLNDANFIVPSAADTFIVKLPWRDFFAKFKMRCEKGKFLLDFIYKHETFESLIKQPTNDVHILCKSTVWGSADVYYSTELLKGTCTKILFNDIDARNTFALKFFKYLNYENSGFSIRELLDDLKYLWGEDDDNLSIDVPWKDIFKGLYMGEEGGKYSLEFIFNQEENKNGSN